MIYLNNIETTMPKPEPVIHAVSMAMVHMGNASRGTHDSALQASMTVYETRRKLARFFGCSRPDHVVFTSGGTEALNIAVKGSILPGSHVLTTSESACTIMDSMDPAVSYDLISADINWKTLPDILEKQIRPETCAVICSHACPHTGNLYDLKQPGSFCRLHHLLFIVDASQTAGIFPIDMEENNIDILCFSGHKYLFGPQGTGGLCIRPGIEIRPFKSGGSGVQSYSQTQPTEYPARLEAGTLNSHGIAGLSAALDLISEMGIDRIRQRELDLMYRFYHKISTSDRITIHGNFCSIPRIPAVTLNLINMEPSVLIDRLRQSGIVAGLMTSSVSGPSAAVFSFSPFNTEEEVDTAADTLLAIASQDK